MKGLERRFGVSAACAAKAWTTVSLLSKRNSSSSPVSAPSSPPSQSTAAVKAKATNRPAGHNASEPLFLYQAWQGLQV